MTDIAIVAWGAVSALGEGPLAVRAGAVGAPARTAVARDEELARAGLVRPFAARVPSAAGADDALALLERALAGCAADLDARRPAWRNERVGVVLGTSSGPMRAAVARFGSLEEACSDEKALERAAYYGPVARAVRGLGLEVDPCVVVLGACASASLAIGLGARWIERAGGGPGAACDLVLAGGFDAVTVFVAAGFEVLRATTATPPPRPFRSGRDGMALGDGAAVIALAREGARSPHAYVLGFGASSDAVHLTAPDRDGAGLARAARRALDDAGDPPIDLVSAHATATPFNDAAEFRAIERALGAEAARRVPVHAFKASIGHTLGAGGALELLASLDALDRGILPASAGHAGDEGATDPATPVRLLARSAPASVATALKLSSAFGGANAALVVGPPVARSSRSRGTRLGAAAVPAPRARGPAWLQGGVHVDRVPPLESLAPRTRLPIERVGRGDDLVLLALAAVAELETQCGPLEGAGVVVGTALATIETNALFAARLRERGPLAAEPRRFPYTSPNAVAGECSIAFGLTGPCFSVGGGLYAGLEALACAAILVESGDAPRMIAVAVDQTGPVTRALAGDSIGSGAVAFLLTSPAAASRAAPRACVGAITLRRGSAGGDMGEPGERGADPAVPPSQRPVADRAGHRALVALAESVYDPRVPDAIECHASPDAWARIEFAPLGTV